MKRVKVDGGVYHCMKGQRKVDEKLAKRVLEKNGKLSRSELLRCRIRYFTDGLIVGSKGFIDGFFNENCGDTVKRRRSGPREMLGGD